MSTDTMMAVFEDFNEPGAEPPPAPVENPPPPLEEIDGMREAAWTEGYLTGRQERSAYISVQPLMPKLLTALDALEAKTSEAVDAASLAVADLLVSTVLAATSDSWSARLLDRVRIVADQIKPALSVAPEFVLRESNGTEHRFGDLADLSQALDAGDNGEDVTIRWQRGESTISRTALLENLREAIIPLLVDQSNEQNPRNQS
ncbi:MAG TPA: hypothetical protein VGC09_02600 [Rhodopila sp.]